MSAQFDDIDHMRRIAAQDQPAFHALYQQYGTAVYSLAYRVLQNAMLAEEVTQDTFLKIWRQKAQWDPEKGNLKTWLLSVTHFTAIDRVRQEKRQPSQHPESIEDIPERMARELVAPSQAHDAGWQDGVVLRMLIQQLPDEQAHLIDLAFFRGMTHSQIADETKLPLGTVKTRLRTGLQRLRELWLETVQQESANS